MSWLSRLRMRTKLPMAERRQRSSRRQLLLENLESRELLHSPTRPMAIVSPTSPPVTYSPLGVINDPTSNQHFITGLYYNLLGREPSLGEVNGWVNSLQIGAPRGLALEIFLVSPEYRDREIQGAYNAYLGRDAEGATQSFWFQQMEAGASYKALLGGLLSSDEFYARQGGNATGFVVALYNDLLFRAPEPSALGAWVGALQSGHMSRATAVSALMNSPEASAQFVDQAYHAIFGRAPDSQGLATWAPMISAGMSTDLLRLYLAGSTEYSDLQDGTAAPVVGLDTTSTPEPILQNPTTILSQSSNLGGPIQGAAPGKVTVGSTIDINRQTGNQSEVAIGINPTNTSQMFAFANDNALNGNGMSASFSTDGGATWTSRVLGDGTDGLPSAFTDPWVAWDTFGNLFISYLGMGTGQNLVMAVDFSTDGGKTFKSAGTFQEADHPEVAVGPGTVAVTVNNTSDQIGVLLAPVTGLGQVGAFQVFTAPGSTSGNFGDIAVGPSGQVATVWQQATSGVGPDVISVSVDPDGLGPQPLSNPTTVTNTNVGSFRPIAAQPERTVLANASLSWDLSNGPHRGRLYMSYCNAANTTTDDLDVFMRFSDDNGKTWSAPIKVDDDTSGRSQFFPRVAVDQSTGNVAVAWYDCRLDPGSGAFDTDGVANTDVVAFGTVSTDGGATWSTNFQIAAGPSNALRISGENNTNDFGDYNGIAFAGGKLFYAWTDNSPNLIGNTDKPNFDIATAQVVVSSGGGGGGGGGAPILNPDVFELDDTSDRPANLGIFSGTQTFKNLSIVAHANLLPDYDWYSFVAGKTGPLTTTIAYIPSGSGDLGLRVYTVDANNTLIQLGASQVLHTTFQQVTIGAVPEGTRILVWVYGFNFAQAAYEMNLTL